MIYNIHNFRIKVPAWALLLVVLLSVGIASMGDLTPYGVSTLINNICTKAIPAMLTVCAAVFYSPTTGTTPGVNPEPTPVPAPAPAPIVNAPEAAA